MLSRLEGEGNVASARLSIHPTHGRAWFYSTSYSAMGRHALRRERQGGHRDHMSRPGIAAVLSFFIPGLGQIYNGDILRGLFWLIITPGFWLGTGGCLGWVCHLISAATAHNRAEDKQKGMRVRVV